MTELLTAAQMRAIEGRAIESGAVTGLELMERAGQGVVDAVLSEWPDLAEGTRRGVVLCGPGNNGGDGFVVARLLKGRGWEMEVFLYGDAGNLPPDAKANYERWVACGGTVAAYDGAALVLAPPCLFVDALFGIGQTRALSEELESTAAHIALLNGMMADIRTVAVDVPSGVNSDTGAPIGSIQFFSDLTVTFHARKPCHVPPHLAAQCGKVSVVDIGL